MPISTWIRDLFGIRKDVIDTKKAKLEITKLQAEERERDLITPATLDDVKEYDLKVKTLLTRKGGISRLVADTVRTHLSGDIGRYVKKRRRKQIAVIIIASLLIITLGVAALWYFVR